MAKNQEDKILLLAQKASDKILDLVGKSEDHAVFSIAVRLEEGETEDTDQVHTFLDAGGYYGILAQGLYAELRNQIENDQPQLFAILRDVIHDLEEDLGIAPDEDLGENVAPTIH